MCPSDVNQAEALSELIEKYSWEKIGIVSAKGMYGEEMSADIKNSLQRKAIDVTTVSTFKERSRQLRETMTKVGLHTLMDQQYFLSVNY